MSLLPNLMGNPAPPFGGFDMSGTDSKAGGRDYLLLFTQAKVISEKLAP
jgi:acyl-CoA reductase-like NAD-dependent aldehyde dehydrogenase